MPRKHKIDNNRTRRHMYRHAPEALFYTYTVDYDDLILNSQVEEFFKNELLAHSKKLTDKLSNIIRHKHYRSRNVRIPIEIVTFQDYDIYFNNIRFVIEARYTPNKERENA